MVSPLLSRSGVLSFEPILRARADVFGPLRVSIDGGAGWGDTAKAIVAVTAEDGLVYAFEPFPGNHGFFKDCDPRVKLMKLAIADQRGVAKFVVPSVVDSTEAWAERGLSGYSSVGYLEAANRGPLWKQAARTVRNSLQGHKLAKASTIEVEVTTIAAAVSEPHIDFLKLDLQGAELKALIGMGELLTATDLLWIEFNNQPGLFNFLCDCGFLIFDTNYLCVDASEKQLAAKGLEAQQIITLSTSVNAVLARRVLEQNNYLKWFEDATKEAGVWQTDFLCVNPAYIGSFFKILGRLD